jgi:tetratricopeptide (TPR) repeat protein
MLILSACDDHSGQGELNTARKLSTEKPSEAVDQYKKIVQVNQQDPIGLKAAQEAESLCLKEKICSDNEEFFLRHIIKKSENENEQISAQKRLSEYYFDKGFYSQAIEELARLLSKGNFKEGREGARLMLAKSNFYIKNFFQAEVELSSYIKEVKSDQEKFEGYLLKADIQSANKKYIEAMATYANIKANFRELYFKNQVFMNEVLLLEEQKLLDQAVKLLESIKTESQEIQSTDFIDAKIEKLKEQKTLMPGATGLKK